MPFLSIFELAVDGTVGPAARPCKGGVWQDTAPIPIASYQRHTTVALSYSTLVILGGVASDEESCTLPDIIQQYNIPSDTWSSAITTPVSLNHANTAVVNGNVYLLGGLSRAPDGVLIAVPDSWVYNAEANEWDSIAPMPNGTARGSAAMGAHENKIYLSGGVTTSNVAGDSQDSMDTILAFDTTYRTWDTISKRAPERRDHTRSAVARSKSETIGSRFLSRRALKDIVFSVELEKAQAAWEAGSASVRPSSGCVLTGTAGTPICDSGGESDQAEGLNIVLNKTRIIDSTGNRCRSSRSVRLPIRGASAVAVEPAYKDVVFCP